MSQSDRTDGEPPEGRVIASFTMRGYVLHEGVETVVAGLPWHSGELKPPQGTMAGSEHKEPRWFGSKVVEEPGR